jgi:uncharacterized membrane protein YbaN (DUF454 family)
LTTTPDPGIQVRRRGVVADSRAARIAFIAGGHVCLGLGITGVILPVLPGVVFLIGSAACYARGSMRFYNWLLGHRWLGPPVRDWEEHRAMTLRAKVVAIVMLVGGIAVTIVFVVKLLWVRAMLAVMAIGLTTLIVFIKTRREPAA